MAICEIVLSFVIKLTIMLLTCYQVRPEFYFSFHYVFFSVYFRDGEEVVIDTVFDNLLRNARKVQGCAQ